MTAAQRLQNWRRRRLTGRSTNDFARSPLLGRRIFLGIPDPPVSRRFCSIFCPGYTRHCSGRGKG
uniref:Uncharacterized protein n=1 Tax=Setaria viridis TaxID=4556 RepID=A0A4U6WFV8_SETVI|nr:hypothetical protein SEVIR_1G334566v2 [Setaria viridis]